MKNELRGVRALQYFKIEEKNEIFFFIIIITRVGMYITLMANRCVCVFFPKNIHVENAINQ